MTLDGASRSVRRDDAFAPPVATTTVRWVLRQAMVAPINLYSMLVSPVLFGHYGPACRFEPPCSAYAREAILHHGLRRGIALGLRRLLRCRPGGGFGHDPVPIDRVPPASVARA